MTDEIKIPQRQIIINGFDDHIDVRWDGYQNFLLIIFELQTAIGIIQKKAQEKSNIIIPTSKLSQ